MRRLIDCFLYHNEEQLLEIRLQLLGDVVDRFVIVCSKETFTGKMKTETFPTNNAIINSLSNKIDLISLDALQGKTTWEREAYSRNQLAAGVSGLSETDLIMVSDVDELPRPSVLRAIKSAAPLNTIKTLELEYFNFKFNYKLFHGIQAVWAGPSICTFVNFTSPQAMRDGRWSAIASPETRISNAGWHFSYLTAQDNVRDKLQSFSHQEKDVQSRTELISELLSKRQGFHDHLHPGSVWGFIDVSELDCLELVTLIRSYPDLYDANSKDDENEINDKIKRSMEQVCLNERAKILRRCEVSELISELKRRMFGRLRRILANH